MAVAIIATDSWIQHLPFVGGRRPSAYGPIDGVWYGVVAGDGDAGGGNFSLNGLLSFDRKEDWVYILGGVTSSNNGGTSMDAFNIVNTGPLIPTAAVATAINNPSFPKGGTADTIASNAITVQDLQTGGADYRAGMPIFGDKRIAGAFGMIASGWQTNLDGVTYQMSAWGFLVEYASFFRNAPPAFG